MTLPTEEQLEVFRTHGESIRFAMVWRFFFGLGSKKQGGQVSKKVVCLGEVVVDTLLSLPRYIGHENELLKCHCALEAMDVSVSSKVAKDIDGKFGDKFESIAHTPHDCVAVLNVLAHTSHCHSVCINLSRCGLSDKLLKRLTDILSSAGGELKVVELDLNNNKLTSNGVSDLFTRASAAFSSLHRLSLDNNNIDCDGVNSIVTSLVHTSCKSLTRLSLSDNPLGVTGILTLERAVEAGVLVNMKHLFLANTLNGDADINGALFTTLLKSISSHCPHLFNLALSHNNLAVPGACALGEALPLLTNVSYLYLDSTMLDSEAIIAFTDCINNIIPVSNKSLIQPSRIRTQSDSSCSSSSEELECLDLLNNNIDDDGVAALIEQVPHLFPSLKLVHIYGNPVSAGMEERLEECLKNNIEVSCYIVEQWMCFLILNTICASYWFSNIILVYIHIVHV